MRVLIVEDDHRLATTLRRVLTEAGMSADVKPFSQRELLARIRALSRRQPGRQPDALSAGPIRLDRVAHIVLVGDRRVELTPKEFAILEHFMTTPAGC